MVNVKKAFSAVEKKKLADAGRFCDARDFRAAAEIMTDLVGKRPDSAPLRAVLANMLWQSGDLKKAEKEFRRATDLRPKSELFSLGLYHCLMDRNETDKAFEEMKRFIEISDSRNFRRYRELIKGFTRSPKKYRVMLKEVREGRRRARQEREEKEKRGEKRGQSPMALP